MLYHENGRCVGLIGCCEQGECSYQKAFSDQRDLEGKGA